jgi:hypothetical protein
MRPHYVDPQSNIVYDTNNADFEGWLTKQSAWLKVSTDFFPKRCDFCNAFLSDIPNRIVSILNKLKGLASKILHSQGI